MIKYPLEIEFTNHCSLKCISCISKDLKNKGFMSEETFDNIIDFIIKNNNNIDFLAIAGLGDIFMHPDILLYLDKLEKLKPYDIVILIPTKGTTLTDEIINKIYFLKENGLNINIQLGIFSINEDIANFMGGLYDNKIKCFSFNYYEKFKSVIKKLKYRNLDFSIELLLTKFSENEIDAFHNFCHKLGVDGIVHKLHNFGGKLKTYNILSSNKKSETRCAGVELKDKESEYYGDVCGFYPFIDYKGDIFPGTFCMHYNLGNINSYNGDFIEIINKCYKTIDKDNHYCKVCSDNFANLNKEN